MAVGSLAAAMVGEVDDRFSIMTNEQLARYIASRYDAKQNYTRAYNVLVDRVGEVEADRMVDQA